VSVYGVEWLDPHQPVVRPEWLATIHWIRMPAFTAMTVLSGLILAARTRRLSAYSTCRFCEVTKPPESMHAVDACQACAEKYLGVVY
jgi:hypothetical protein